MMLRHVAYEELSLAHQQLLVAGLAPAPAWVRPTIEETLDKIWQGEQQVFAFPNGLLLVSKQTGKGESRLSIDAFVCTRGYGQIVKSLITDLRQLASDWSCDKIETTCFAKGLLQIITKLGGRIESVTVTLET